MGWNLYSPELTRAWQAGQSHHLPDLVCAFGRLPHRVFSDGLGGSRVGLIGGIRYSFGGAVAARRESEPVEVLVATSSGESEAVGLIHAASIVMANRVGTVVFKFHPLLPLDAEVRRIAKDYPSLNYRITDEPISELLDSAALMICGGTSAAMEAVVAGCMPLVFRPIGELAANPMLHVPAAAFLWTTIDELQAAIDSCLQRDDAYEERKAAWPAAVSEHLYKADGLTNQRLYEFMVERGVV
jgi:hypothetical protein